MTGRMHMLEQMWQSLGTSETMAGVLGLAARFATTTCPILLTGEPGTGKTLFAKQIHDLSGRAGGFVKQGCRGLAADTGLAELCGHTAGAFTGARSSRKGLLETAHGGTLLLEEIGIAPLPVQEYLLQILEDPNVRRLGEDRPRPLDVRFVATTNEDLEAALAKGTVRADLLDRFGPFRLRLPPLRERRDEILPLARFFLQRAAAERSMPVPRLMPDAIRALRSAMWPGNVRELAQACSYAIAVVDEGEPITAGALPPLSRRRKRNRNGRLAFTEVSDLLRRTGGNVAQAARESDWCERQIRRVRDRGAAEN